MRTAIGSGRGSQEAARRESRMEMTPMIDVTFLLLVFFLCTVRFKILEGKIPTWLPREGRGTDITLPLERLEVEVERVVPVTTHDEGGHPLRWVWREEQISISVQGRRMAGLADLSATLRRVRQRQPEVKTLLRCWPGTLYVDAVKVVNEFLRQGLTDVTFTRIPDGA